MTRTNKRRSRKAGLPPGSPVYIGDDPVRPPTIAALRYNKEMLEERTLSSVTECKEQIGDGMVTWINIAGVSDTSLIQQLGAELDLHELVIEDLVNTLQRPKVEDYGGRLFVVLRMARLGTDPFHLQTEQVSIVLGDNFVLSLEEGGDDFFRLVRERLRSKGRIRTSGADYLAYVLVDSVVDHLFVVLEALMERIEALEMEVMFRPSENTLPQIYASKRAVMALKRTAWPLNEVAASLERTEVGLVTRETKLFLRDVHDHTIEIIDTVSSMQDMNHSMLDTYLSGASNRMNSVMQVLTVITTIFMPLTFIAGIYGMNFEHMPELHSPYAYPAVLGLMVVIALVMLYWFRRKRWL